MKKSNENHEGAPAGGATCVFSGGAIFIQREKSDLDAFSLVSLLPRPYPCLLKIPRAVFTIFDRTYVHTTRV